MASLAAGVADITPKYRPSPIMTGLLSAGIFGAVALASHKTRESSLEGATQFGFIMAVLAFVYDSHTQAGYEAGFRRGIEAH
jgi:hypothetical protein